MKQKVVRCIDDHVPWQYDEKQGCMVYKPSEERYLESLTLGKEYAVLEERDFCYRIVDDTEEDYLYPTTMFKVVE